jgi:ABC-type xylose transport system permease subunit
MKAQQRLFGFHRMGHYAGTAIGMPLAYLYGRLSAPTPSFLVGLAAIVAFEIAIGIVFYVTNRKLFEPDA